MKKEQDYAARKDGRIIIKKLLNENQRLHEKVIKSSEIREHH